MSIVRDFWTIELMQEEMIRPVRQTIDAAVVDGGWRVTSSFSHGHFPLADRRPTAVGHFICTKTNHVRCRLTFGNTP